MTPSIPRAIAPTVVDRLTHAAPAVVLLGPRQVGKTTLARQIAATWPQGAVYLDLELPSDRRRLDDAEAYLRLQAPKLVVIDEIHRAPEIFAVLRGLIDERRAAGQRHGHFLLLGSAAIDLMRQSSESLAGRVAYLDMAPVAADEAAAARLPLDALWSRGGFPDSLLADGDARSFAWRQDFIRSYLERDVPMFAPRMPAEALGRLWTMLAHQQGGLLNQAQLAASLGVSAPTLARYVDLLADLQLIRRLSPWSANMGKRLVKSPKVYVRNSGLVHALLGLQTLDDVLGHPVAGASFEGMVVETLAQRLPAGDRLWFYRTHEGAEIDLLIERGGRARTAIEVKRSSAPSAARGFSQACDDLGVEQRWVVYPGTERFPLRHGAQAIGVVELAAQMSSSSG
ncbi:MAG: ATP-binding protein [Acidovorax sp.]